MTTDETIFILLRLVKFWLISGDRVTSSDQISYVTDLRTKFLFHFHLTCFSPILLHMASCVRMHELLLFQGTNSVQPGNREILATTKERTSRTVPKSHIDPGKHWGNQGLNLTGETQQA